MSLTARQIDAAKPADKPYKLADAHGLYLYVSKTGAKSWRANYRHLGKQKTVTYGRWPDMTLADARKAHADFKHDGPASGSAPTFREVADDWLKLKLPTLSNAKHQTQVSNTLERFALPAFGGTPVDQIKRTDIVSVVRAVADRGTVETAHRVAGRISAVFHHAMAAGYIESHPAIGIRRVLPTQVVKEHHATVGPDEVGDLLRAINGYGEPVARIGLLLLAHTFVRTSELRLMRWVEIKQADKVWVVPAERMKRRIPHVVPLSIQVLALLDELRDMTGSSEWAFESLLRGPSNQQQHYALRPIPARIPWPHDRAWI